MSARIPRTGLGIGLSLAVLMAACTSGQTTYGGARAFGYCGTASGAVTFGGRTLSYRGGSCRRTAVAVELNIGIAVLGKTAKPLPRYLGVLIGRLYGVGAPATHDGTYREGTIAFVDGGKRYASMSSRVVLAGGRTRGTFTAELFGGKSVSGTFRCS